MPFSWPPRRKSPAENAVLPFRPVRMCRLPGHGGGQVPDILSEERSVPTRGGGSRRSWTSRPTRPGRSSTPPACLGVIAAGGSDEQIAAAAQFAGLIGLAFQIRDDMLDVIGTAQEMGKDVGHDDTKTPLSGFTAWKSARNW